MEVSFISKNVDRKNEALINENIRAERVLVIDDDGTSLGEKPLAEAIKIANSKNLDLVCVAPNAKIPVTRFMDYSKYRYEMQKKAREAKKNQKVVNIKEIRLSPVISSNDYETKVKRGISFLEDGDKLKVSLTFNRRMRMLYQGEVDISNLEKIIKRTEEIANVEQAPTREGRNISMILAPKKDKK